MNEPGPLVAPTLVSNTKLNKLTKIFCNSGHIRKNQNPATLTKATCLQQNEPSTTLSNHVGVQTAFLFMRQVLVLCQKVLVETVNETASWSSKKGASSPKAEMSDLLISPTR
jgi:hypothetical protein